MYVCMYVCLFVSMCVITEYDCKTPEGRCGFNPSFCASLPATMLVDSVRVYQKAGDKDTTVGCNPPGYPTKKWIQAHEYR